MTFFAAIIDTATGVMSYANAGHNFPLLIAASDDENPSPRKITSLSKTNGMPLGFDATAHYQDAKLPLRPGDKVVFFTDGLLECRSSDHKQWGKALFMKALKMQPSASADDLLKATLAKADAHFQNMPLADDVTLVVAEFRGKSHGRQTDAPSFGSLPPQTPVSPVIAAQGGGTSL